MGLLHRIAPTPPTAAEPQVTTPGDAASLPATAGTPGQTDFVSASSELKKRLKRKIIAQIDPDTDFSLTSEVRQNIRRLFDRTIEEEKVAADKAELDHLFELLVADLYGFGP